MAAAHRRLITVRARKCWRHRRRRYRYMNFSGVEPRSGARGHRRRSLAPATVVDKLVNGPTPREMDEINLRGSSVRP